MKRVGPSLAVAFALSIHPGNANADGAGVAATTEIPIDLRVGRAKLDFLGGAWRVERFRPTAGGAWQTVDISNIRFENILKGRFLETTVVSDRFTYRLVFSFDTAQQIYRIVSMDDQSGLADVYEGAFDVAGALEVTNLKSGTHYLYEGVRYHNRMRFEQVADGWAWQVDMSADGGATWRPQLRILARRPSSAAGQ